MSRSRDTKRWKQSRHCRETAYRIGHRGYISRTFSWISEVKCINVARLLSMCAPRLCRIIIFQNMKLYRFGRIETWNCCVSAVVHGQQNSRAKHFRLWTCSPTELTSQHCCPPNDERLTSLGCQIKADLVTYSYEQLEVHHLRSSTTFWRP